MASAVVARFGGSIGSRSLSSFVGRGALRAPLSAPLPATWAASKRCMSTVYAESHEYLTKNGDIGTVGITAYATKSLGDIVFVDLPSVGDTFEAGESFGSVESVKAASDVYAPAAGEVVEINEALTETPGMLNEDPMGKGWFMKLKITGALPETLLDQAAYDQHITKSG